MTVKRCFGPAREAPVPRFQPVPEALDVSPGPAADQREAGQRLLESESRRREGEEQLRLATEAAEIGLWDVAPLSNTPFWPPRVKAMFGISPNAPVSMAEDFSPCLHPEDRSRDRRPRTWEGPHEVSSWTYQGFTNR